ncbi:MAG: ribonuclease III [Phycisphaerales bacterium]|nr:ribonuclease III [Phycisphaerales bacterium]
MEQSHFPQPPERGIVEQALGYTFKDRALLERALIHASVAPKRLDSNERLEFFGDAILGVIICERLFLAYPNALEGELTKVKSNIVSRKVCAEVAKELGFDQAISLGKGMGSREQLPLSLLAAVFESVVGALYLDAGFEVTREFVLRVMNPRIVRAHEQGHQENFKSVLQQTLQRGGGATPDYLILAEEGPDHLKCFHICAVVGERRFAMQTGASKKEAEQAAALAALVELGLARIDESTGEADLNDGAVR